jgi:DNA-binding GntR family transcriptional regulator
MVRAETDMLTENAPDLIRRRSLHDELAGRLRELIVEGDLDEGEKIPEKDLCARFGVSRTPLREALKVLASEGLVTLTPNRGASVSALTLQDLEEVFPVMGALESLSGELACATITEAELARIRALHEDMVACWRDGDRPGYFRLNQTIHQTILEATRNPTLIAAHRALSGRIRRARYLANMSDRRWAQAVREHEDILEALEERNAARLGRLLKRHVRNKLDTVRDWIAQGRA